MEIIVDYGSYPELKMKNYIIPGSFYVAITRVREGNNLYLRSFDPSYIQVNVAIQSKIDAMIKFKQYEFKKTFLNQQIFDIESQEIKIGYLNINGLKDANHIGYFDSDKNLYDLDYIVLAETKLIKTDKIKEHLHRWIIVARYDAKDSKAHMGLLLLKSKKSNMKGQVSVSQVTIQRHRAIQIEGLIVGLSKDFKFEFVYCN